MLYSRLYVQLECIFFYFVFSWNIHIYLSSQFLMCCHILSIDVIFAIFIEIHDFFPIWTSEVTTFFNPSVNHWYLALLSNQFVFNSTCVSVANWAPFENNHDCDLVAKFPRQSKMHSLSSKCSCCCYFFFFTVFWSIPFIMYDDIL